MIISTCSVSITPCRNVSTSSSIWTSSTLTFRSLTLRYMSLGNPWKPSVSSLRILPIMEHAGNWRAVHQSAAHDGTRPVLGLSRGLAQVREFLGRAGCGDVKPLRVTDSQSTELGQHLRRLHPLGDGLDAHGLADLADRLDHASIDSVVRDVFHELSVNLEIVDRQRLQIHERRQ